jgi:hypothetical protein
VDSLQAIGLSEIGLDAQSRHDLFDAAEFLVDFDVLQPAIHADAVEFPAFGTERYNNLRLSMRFERYNIVVLPRSVNNFTQSPNF